MAVDVVYQLTAEDVKWDQGQSATLIRAIVQLDTALLEALLARHAASIAVNTITERKREQLHYGPLGPSGVMSIPDYLLPIIAATDTCLLHNVHHLLNEGADPNGINLVDLEEYSAAVTSETTTKAPRRVRRGPPFWRMRKRKG